MRKKRIMAFVMAFILMNSNLVPSDIAWAADAGETENFLGGG